MRAKSVWYKVSSEDRDSGTESDDERAFDQAQFASDMSSDPPPTSSAPWSAAVRSSPSPSSSSGSSSRPASQTSADPLIVPEAPLPSPMVVLPPAPHSRRPPRFHGYMLRGPPAEAGEASQACSVGRPSAIVPPTSASVSPPRYEEDALEQHSSEEELETLTRDAPWSSEGAAGTWGGSGSEKRKWSQVTACRLSTLNDSGSSDDELPLQSCPLPPVRFRTSPPLEAHKPLRSTSPPTKIASLLSAAQPIYQQQQMQETHQQQQRCAALRSEAATLASGRAASPRKRHRHHTPRPQRPCLDFEKMQQMKDRAVTQWRNGGELSLSFF